MKDNYLLERFLDAQESTYETAKQELLNGKKVTHWIWWIFPQAKGLGRSFNSTYYGLDGLNEAKAYWQNDILRSRLIEVTTILLNCPKTNIYDIVGNDSKKIKSCMEIFYAASHEEIFKKVLVKYYEGLSR